MQNSVPASQLGGSFFVSPQVIVIPEYDFRAGGDTRAASKCVWAIATVYFTPH